MIVERIHTVAVEEVPVGGGLVDYVAICSCRWESRQMSSKFDAVTARCEVFEAELAGAKRRAQRRSLMAATA